MGDSREAKALGIALKVIGYGGRDVNPPGRTDTQRRCVVDLGGDGIWYVTLDEPEPLAAFEELFELEFEQLRQALETAKNGV